MYHSTLGLRVKKKKKRGTRKGKGPAKLCGRERQTDRVRVCVSECKREREGGRVCE